MQANHYDQDEGDDQACKVQHCTGRQPHCAEARIYKIVQSRNLASSASLYCRLNDLRAAQPSPILPDYTTSMMESSTCAYRASLLYFNEDPAFSDAAYHWHKDGLLVISKGHIVSAGDYADLINTLPAGTSVVDFRG